jgi:hypothetical protein
LFWPLVVAGNLSVLFGLHLMRFPGTVLALMIVRTGAKAAIGIAGALMAAVAWIVWSQSGTATPGTPADLIDRLGEAERRPSGAAFDVGPVTIEGESIRAVATPAASRITWELRLPDRARLELAVALKPETWNVPGDGVLFRVGIAEGRTHEDIVTRVVNPYRPARRSPLDSAVRRPRRPQRFQMEPVLPPAPDALADRAQHQCRQSGQRRSARVHAAVG